MYFSRERERLRPAVLVDGQRPIDLFFQRPQFFAIARLFDFLIAKPVVAKVVVVFLGVLTPPKKQQQRFVRQDGFLR